MKREQDGFILVLTASFMLIFLLFGLAVAHFSGFQAQGIATKTQSTQAFWLAEAGVQQAITYLAPNVTDFTLGPNALGEGNYSNYTANVTALSGVRWDVNATGTVQGVRKEVYVHFGPDIFGCLVTEGPQDIGNNANDSIEEPKVPNATFSFDGLFGMTMDEMLTYATHTYDDPENNVGPVDGITFVNLSSGANMRITEDNWVGSGLLVVRSLGEDPGLLTITGGTFTGIIYTIGEMKVGAGNVNIAGAVYVECGDDVTKITGTPTMEFNTTAIDAAFLLTNSTALRVLSWREVW